MHNKKFSPAQTLLATVALLLVVVHPAYGYTDPGTGLMLWQVIGAAFVGSLFYLKRFLGWLGLGRKKD
jgi:hypothetical protein